MSGSGVNRREHFRLRYPPGAGPLLAVGARAFEVVELSEHGLQFAASDATPGAGEAVSGTLQFADAVDVAVAGEMVRKVDGVATLRLTRGVGLDRMIVEQKRIIREFPEFLPRHDS